MTVKIDVYEVQPKERQGPYGPFRADIVGKGFNHHGEGPSKAEALIQAAMHWHKHGDKNADS